MKQERSKVYIEYEFKDGPFGGANQSLKCLRDYLVRNGLYSETPAEAKYILINHTRISKDLLRLKQECPEKIFIHRVDGPVAKHRKHAKILDKHSFFLDRLLCDGTVFQSQWTYDSCVEEGYKKTGQVTVIHNAPDPTIFGPKEARKTGRSGEKCRLIATSWSPNWNKGFDVLQYLDQTLDFNRYEFLFVGNSPIEFQNIRHLPPKNSKELSELLKQQDIYVAASRSESCSNSLLEAMNCGLVVIARESGCYREVIKEGGILVQKAEEMLPALEQLVNHMEEYQQKLPYFDIEQTGASYYAFMEQVGQAIGQGEQTRKVLTSYGLFRWNCFCFYIRVRDKLRRMLKLS